MLTGEGFLQASDRVPRIALEFERDFLLQDLEGEFSHTLTGRRDSAATGRRGVRHELAI